MTRKKKKMAPKILILMLMEELVEQEIPAW